MKGKRIIIFLLITTIFTLITLGIKFSPVSAKITGDENEGTFLNLGGEDLGKSFGSFAIGFLALGFGYVMAKRSYLVIRKVGKHYENEELLKTSKDIYMRSRKPLFYLHVITNLVATGFGLIHGLSVELEKINAVNSGILALVLMTLLSISGLIIWKKFWPFWETKETKKLVNAVHRQWLFTFILIALLGIHVLLVKD